MATYTLEQCDTAIAALEAGLDELALLPDEGATGKTRLKLDGATGRANDRLETWKLRRAAVLNGGHLPRLRRDC